MFGVKMCKLDVTKTDQKRFSYNGAILSLLISTEYRLQNISNSGRSYLHFLYLFTIFFT